MECPVPLEAAAAWLHESKYTHQLLIMAERVVSRAGHMELFAGSLL